MAKKGKKLGSWTPERKAKWLEKRWGKKSPVEEVKEAVEENQGQ